MKKEFWEMLDEADAINYDKIADNLKADLQVNVESAVEKSDENIRIGVKQASRKLYTNMDQFKESERECGPALETWKKYSDNHETIKDNLQELKRVQEEKKDNRVIQEKSSKTIEAFDEASQYFAEERKILLEREKVFRQELQAVKENLEQMQKDMSGNYPEEMKKFMTAGMALLEKVEEIKKEAKAQKPLVAAQLLNETKVSVHKVYNEIREMPGKIKEAIKNKSYEMIDFAVRKTADVFDKGIKYLTEKRNATLKLSPLQKQKEVEKPKQRKFSLKVEPRKKSKERERQLSM